MLSHVFAIAVLVVSVLVINPASADDPRWPPMLTIVTASSGGTYHTYGAGMARILTRVLGLPVVEQTTEGPRENIQLIEAGDAQLGFVTMGVALQAWNGTGDWIGGKQYREMHALFPMYVRRFTSSC